MSKSSSNVYNQRNIETMETVYGTGYLSMGGDEEVGRIVSSVSVEGRDVLDLGCGMGGAVVTLARDHGARSVQGLDIDAGLLARAEELVQRAGQQDRVNLTRVEPGPVPLESSSFDVVYVTAVTCHLQEQELRSFLAEIERLLRPGGYLVGGEWFKAKGNEAFIQWDNMLREHGLNFYFISREVFQGLLSETGFTEISILDRTQATTDNARDCLNRVENELHDRLLQSMNEEDYADLKSWTQVRLTGLDGGGMHYGHFCARKRPD